MCEHPSFSGSSVLPSQESRSAVATPSFPVGSVPSPGSRIGARPGRSSLTSLILLGCLTLCGVISIGCSPNESSPPAGETAAAKQERLVQEAFAIQDQATKLLFGITDQASAEAAMGGLEQLKAQVVKLVGEVKQVGEMTPETRQRITAEVEKRKAEIQQQVTQFAGRLMTKPQLLQALQPVLKKVDELRQAFDGVLR